MSPLLEKLPHRQKQCINLALQGWSNKKIAKHLGIKRGTVEDHLRKVYCTLDVEGSAPFKRNRLLAMLSQPIG